jgi:putative DNA primase/helicase
MRIGARLVGCQLIDGEGNKKFLYGQQTKGASFVMDAKGVPIFCEGYATALSIRAVMQAMKVRYTLYVCFSAGNLKDVARGIEGGIVVADNDPNGVGEKAARDAQKPYWLSDTAGEDFNDFHARVGLFAAMFSLKKALFSSAASASGAKTLPQSAAPSLA